MKLPPLGLATLLLFAAGFVPAATAVSAADGLPSDARTLQIGDPAPDFSLPGVDGKSYTLADFQNSELLMVIFLSNHCPDSHATEGRLKRLRTDLTERSLAVVAINPNNPDAIRLEELSYSKYSDSFPEMKLYAKEQGFTFPYLYDGETQKTAKAYGCLATPHVFIFDRNRRLRYRGRFDDSRFPELDTVKSADARNAIAALLAGRPVPTAITRVHGCSTKWLEKKSQVAVFNAKWDNTPVTIEKIDAAGAAALARNDTKKYRIINLWATSCAPCVAEFPALVALGWRMSMRPVELVTISLDDPKLIDKARRFLAKNHAGIPLGIQGSVVQEGRRTNNYLDTDSNADALAKALDPQWDGALPHTIVVAPGGKIIFRQTGPVDVDQLKDKMLAELTTMYR